MKVFRVVFDLDDEELKTYAKCAIVLTTDADKAIQFVKEMYPNILKILIDAKFHIHSMNPIGRENMMRIIKRNGWSLS